MGKQQPSHVADDLKKSWPPFVMKRISEGSFILVLALAGFIFLSLLTYHSGDPGWFHTSFVKHRGTIANAGGTVGAFLADTFYWAFGYASYALPLGFAYLAWIILHDQRLLRTVDQAMLALRLTGLLLLLAGGCSLLTLLVQTNVVMHYGSGGVLGKDIAVYLCRVLNLKC